MTKQLTRQEVEAVVERLVDKTLSEGCIIESDGIKYHVARAAKKIIYCYLTWTDRETNIIKFDRVNDKYQIIGRPVVIGNVIEKLYSKIFLQGEPYFLQLWQPLGFSKSLQEIIDGSGYVTQTINLLIFRDKLEPSDIIKTNYLKSPEANALFTFLQEIL